MMTIQSTMQHSDLGIAQLLRHALQFGGDTDVISQDNGARKKKTLQACADRAARLGAALRARGFGAGDVVATLCNTEIEHFESYLGVPAHGMVLHPLNIRMHDSALSGCIRDTHDRVLIVSQANLERFTTLRPALAETDLRLVVVIGDGLIAPYDGLPVETINYDDLLAEVPRGQAHTLTDPRESAAAAICHTGGTTGQPKPVAFSHRSIWLQAQSLTCANSISLSRNDTLLAAVPLYHVNGWGLPFAAVMAGANLVLPGDCFRPERLDAFIEECGVTIAAGVPTIWTDLMRFRETTKIRGFKTLKRLVTGGTMVPETLIEAMTKNQVDIIQAWGMTETSSMSVLGQVHQHTPGTRPPIGHAMPGLELRVVGMDGKQIDPGCGTVGEIQIRGGCVTQGYLGIEDPDSFDGCWLRTGDIGTLDETGRMTLTDRLKDAIKSGGEWIAAPMLEDALRSMPGVSDAAVIAIPDPRWQERPLAILTCIDEKLGDIEAYKNDLLLKIPSWWLPDGWVVLPSLPRTALGKPDKVALRHLYKTGALNVTFLTPKTGPLVVKQNSEKCDES